MSFPSENKSARKDDTMASVDIQEVNSDNVLESQLRIKAEKALTRKLDLRVMPTLVLTFIVIIPHIDRTSITAARLQGLERDLHLTGIQYNTVVAILFVSYAPMQIPCNMVWHWPIRPSIYIGSCVVLWGIVSGLTGVTRNYIGIMFCRVFTGVPEAAFYPGAAYLLSRWYTRRQLAFRTAILACGLLISNAFGSFMGAGILGTMEGVRGLPAWRWLFIIEGSATVVVGLMTMILLPDYPHNTRWLSASELRLAQMRLAEETGEVDHDTSEDSAWVGLKMAMTDAKVLLFMMLSCMNAVGGSFLNFFPTLVAALGYSTTTTLLLAAYVTGERFFHLTSWSWIGILGYIIRISTTGVGPQYFSLFLLAVASSAFPLVLVWVSNTIPRPPAKRAAAIGLTNGFGNVGSIIGSFVWKAQWGPKYHQSMLIALGSSVLGIATALVMRQVLVRENRALDVHGLLVKGSNQERVEEFARLEGITIEEALVRKKGFRYLY
ncbi:major facilitator superfamily domain-containing protein [Hysterangium stoloniferum]|nr:major facilitator superfamily domain-containing protein [Hysterangium stoloniferum]